MTSAFSSAVFPLTTSNLVNIPFPTTTLGAETHTPKHQMSALSSIVSADKMWSDGFDDDEEDEEDELELHFHYQHEKDTGVKPEEVLESGSKRQSREKQGENEDKENQAIPSTSRGKGLSSSVLGLGMGRPNRLPRSYSDMSDSQTPPPSGSGSTFSNQSSASSARVGSMTDASTASGSSMVPTPPGHGARTSLSSNGSGGGGSGGGSGGSGDRPLGRTYGGSSARTFSRHVSAPLSRQWPREERERSRDSGDLSSSVSNGHTHTHSHSNSTITETQTATIRPKLTQTTSASSVHEERDSVKLLSRSTFVTPGMIDRKMGPGSTARRFVNLSQFGGPARRVKPEEAVDEGEEKHTPVLMPSPSRDSPPSRPHESDAGPSRHSPRSSRPEPSPEPEVEPRFAHRRSPPMVRRHGKEPALSEVIEHMESEQDRDRHRPGSPTAIAVDPERDPYRSRQPKVEPPSRQTHSRYEPRTERPAPQPPRPVETPHRPPDLQYVSPEYHTTPPRITQPSAPAHAPAPIPMPVQSEVRQYTQTAPLPPPEPTRQVAPAPPQPQVQPEAGRKGFIVNGVYYDRVGLLGKGGSSKVYSIMCPIKRTILALKRVTLDRADHETYQSYTNEIELLKRLRGHDRIIQLVDHQITFSPNNRPKVLLMVMECGEIDFSMLLDEQRGKPLNFNFVGLYWQQMLQAVHAVHLENVVHTDLKPANFVLVKGRLKIIDFGIAKAIANDTVNIQRDQQIGTVNYMSPEAISKMTNLNVLKLSYPSDVWSLGCILYQMIYGSAPFAHIPGGPLTKMNYIADPNHRVEYPATAIPRGAPATDQQGQAVDPATMAVTVMPTAIDAMKGCLAYGKDDRLTIPKLLEHEFLQPRLDPAPPMPAGSTPITREQMRRMVEWVMTNPSNAADLGDDLFDQLKMQNGMA